MGTWDELDTELTVANDVDALDDIIDACNSNSEFAELFEPTLKTATELKTAIDDGSKQGLYITAKRLMSREQRYASDKQHRAEKSRASGLLASSIQIEAHSEYQYVVGTNLNHFYPLCVEYGRGEVTPNPPNKRLRFYGEDGYLIYPLKVAKADAYPFVQPAFDSIVDLIEEDGFGVFREVCKEIEKVLKD